MARKFGGRFSPDGAQTDRAETKAVTPSGFSPPLKGQARTSILIALAFLPVVTAFAQSGAISLLGNLLSGAAIFAGALLTREGLKAEAAWAARRISRKPAIPRKVFGAAMIGAGVMLGSATGLQGLLPGAVYGIVAAALHIVAFGLDPMRNKGMEGVDAFQTERVARTISEGEAYLVEMRDAVLRAKDREAEARVASLSARAREMFRAVEDDPRDLTSARRYLGVYLMGARDATIKFAELYAVTRDADAKTDYLKLLDDLERGIGARRDKLLLADRTDLDIEIEVLRDRLKADGLPTGD